MATPHPLARKSSKGYAPRIVAGGIDSSSSDEEASWLADSNLLRVFLMSRLQRSKQAGTTTKLDGGAACSLSSANKDKA
jgi:hypothetical protein